MATARTAGGAHSSHEDKALSVPVGAPPVQPRLLRKRSHVSVCDVDDGSAGLNAGAAQHKGAEAPPRARARLQHVHGGRLGRREPREGRATHTSPNDTHASARGGACGAAQRKRRRTSGGQPPHRPRVAGAPI